MQLEIAQWSGNNSSHVAEQGNPSFPSTTARVQKFCRISRSRRVVGRFRTRGGWVCLACIPWRCPKDGGKGGVRLRTIGAPKTTKKIATHGSMSLDMTAGRQASIPVCTNYTARHTFISSANVRLVLPCVNLPMAFCYVVGKLTGKLLKVQGTYLEHL
ncbi:hypothetical protein LY76DRAFT_184975 [Colletotrichum caudatum]|nr:hypothetical protein LY76DRAFT_184975 [Colletotrichum caudatum]